MNNYKNIHLIDSPSVGKSWLEYMAVTLTNGEPVPDDREEIIECGPLSVVIDGEGRDDELLNRYGDQHIIDIYIEKMFSMKIIEELNSTYGDRIFDNCGVDQFEWIKSRLERKWWTKAASISLLKPDDPGPRIPCLTQLQFVVRSNRVNLHSVFRSQNVFKSYGNFLGLQEILLMMARKLEIKPGKIISYCVCPHIYKSDVEKALTILKQENIAINI